VSRDDKAMIESPGDWPHWPWLPVKRYVGHDMNTALLHADETGQDNRPIPVYVTNLFDVRHYFPTAEMKANALTYPDVAALLADGWQVD
jgi:hypothetical protein